MKRFFVLGLLLVSLVVNALFAYRTFRQNIVVSVADGDSLVLADGRRVRLLGVDAPEKGRCMADEAKARLTEIALGKHVRLKNVTTDTYEHTLANVIIEEPLQWIAWVLYRSPDPFLNRVMVSEGLAKYTYGGTEYQEELKERSKTAQTENKGIYSTQCIQNDPIGGCVIKGNEKNGNKTYHLPECPNYSQTIIDTAYGDTWFCTEAEAIAAGFERAIGCP